MAIKALSWMVRVFEPPVYCYHEIVHNRVVVERFAALGVVFVNDVSEVPAGRPVMLSAHGSGPQVVDTSREVAGISINAVCPLVTKVHHEVKTRAGKGFEILYIGHHGHDEALGTMAVAPGKVHLVETIAELEATPIDAPEIALIAQTTLAVDEWRAIADRAAEMHPGIWMPNKSDLCFATTNRQAAVRKVAPMADVVVVIGSANSSNTNAIEKVARSVSRARIVRINTTDELPDDLSGVVAITAGASAPEDLIEEVVARLNPSQGVEEVSAVEEEEYFPPPRELREFLRGLNSVAAYAFGLDEPDHGPLDRDNTTPAFSVLSELAAGHP